MLWEKEEVGVALTFSQRGGAGFVLFISVKLESWIQLFNYSAIGWGWGLWCVHRERSLVRCQFPHSCVRYQLDVRAWRERSLLRKVFLACRYDSIFVRIKWSTLVGEWNLFSKAQQRCSLGSQVIRTQFGEFCVCVGGRSSRALCTQWASEI